MLKESSKVKIHFCDYQKFPSFEGETITQNHDKTFEVKKQNGKLGIDYNTEQSSYICRGRVFTPFETFSWNVIFEDVKTEKRYHYSNVVGGLEEI